LSGSRKHRKRPALKRGFLDQSKTPKRVKALPSTPNLAEIGARGERRIYTALTQLFGGENVFCNVYARRPTGVLTEIDLLAVHPTGVYVVESKNYAGEVAGDGAAKEWVQTRDSSHRRFYSPVYQNKGHIDALRAACWDHLGMIPPMLSLLVFSDWCMLKITNLPPGLRCCRVSQLTEVLSGVICSVQPVLSPSTMHQITSLFQRSQRCELPQDIPRQHLRDVAVLLKKINRH
jgi:hypothetical protein